MKCYLITAAQLDGEHEYSVHSAFKADYEPPMSECTMILNMDHVFGWSGKNEKGDGLTRIKFKHIREITADEFDVLTRLGLRT